MSCEKNHIENQSHKRLKATYQFRFFKDSTSSLESKAPEEFHRNSNVHNDELAVYQNSPKCPSLGRAN